MSLKVNILILLLIVAGAADDSGKNDALLRSKRGVFDKIWGFFQTVNEAKRLHDEQRNDTASSLNKVLDMLSNTFSDTATTPPPPSEPSNDMSTTTEPYRVSRYEFGRILGRNYRGLQKLYRLELDEALNASQANIKEYQDQLKNSIASFATFD